MPNPPSKTYQVFISHAESDSAVAHQLADSLTSRGLRVFRDDQIKAGGLWMDAIEGALSDSSAYVLLVSPRYQGSKWAHFESGVAVGRATHEKDITVIPVVLPGASWADVPTALRSWQGIDASHSTPEELAQSLGEVLTQPGTETLIVRGGNP